MTADRVVIIGGGVAGLVTAYRLVRAGVATTVLEAGDRWGGQIHTVREDGLVVELGAEGFVARSVSVPALCADLGIEAQLVEQLTTLTFASTPEGLVPLAPGEAARILGFQVPREEFGRGIRSLATGMGALVDTLVAALQGECALQLRQPVERVEALGAGLSVVMRGGLPLSARAVVMAVPSRPAAVLLAPVAGAAAEALAQAPLLSSLSVTLVYDGNHLRERLDGSGFIVPAAAQKHGFRACSFVSSKFAGRTPQDRAMLRAFFRPTPDDLNGLSSEQWVDRAQSAVRAVVAVSGPATRAWVSPWVEALPVHDTAHRERVRTLEAALSPWPIVLAGSAFHGAGIDAAVTSAEQAAHRVIALGR